VQIAARHHCANRFPNAPAENSNKEARLADTSSWIMAFGGAAPELGCLKAQHGQFAGQQPDMSMIEKRG